MSPKLSQDSRRVLCKTMRVPHGAGEGVREEIVVFAVDSVVRGDRC
jgi:hypothetical protein